MIRFQIQTKDLIIMYLDYLAIFPLSRSKKLLTFLSSDNSNYSIP